jgi:hypothetical protein
VRVAAVQQLVKLTKHAGASLTPHIAELAAVLLESLSSLEPQMNTYLQLNVDKYEVSGDAVERARVAASRNSSLAETLDLCMRHMNEAAAEAVIPRLVVIVRQGVGLPTRCGCARFIGQLAVTPGSVGQVVRKHSGKLLKALANACVSDRSPLVRQAMAGAAARVVAVAKEGAVDEYIKELRGAYFERGPEDTSLRVMVGNACKDLLSMAADVMKDYLPQLLPLVWIGREDEEKDAAEAFQAVWEEGAGSTPAGLRVYSTEICDVMRTHLASPSWVVRKMAAKAAFACVDGGDGGDTARAARGVSILPALKLSLSNARMWDGKECVLKALASSLVAVHQSTLELTQWRCGAAPPPPDTAADAGGDTRMSDAAGGDTRMSDAASCSPSTPAATAAAKGPAETGVGVAAAGTCEMLNADAALSRSALLQLLVGECRRKRGEYRKAALDALRMALEKMHDVDVAALVLEVVEEVVREGREETPPPDADARHVSAGRDADEEARYTALMESKGQSELRARALEALAAAWPSAHATRQELAAALLTVVEPFFKSPSMEERLAAISVAAAMHARMSAAVEGGERRSGGTAGGLRSDATGEASGGVCSAAMLAEVLREWASIAPVAMRGLQLGMSDFGHTRRGVRKAALTACQDWFDLGGRLGERCGDGASGGDGVWVWACLTADLRSLLQATLNELAADQTDVKMKESSQALLKTLASTPATPATKAP